MWSAEVTVPGKKLTEQSYVSEEADEAVVGASAVENDTAAPSVLLLLRFNTKVG